MSLQVCSPNTNSTHRTLLSSQFQDISRSSLLLHERSSLIDLTVPGNRLFQNERGEVILIEKTPAEVFGERVLRPVIDEIYSLASYFFSRLPDASSFHLLNVRWLLKSDYLPVKEEITEKSDVEDAIFTEDVTSPSSEKPDRLFRRGSLFPVEGAALFSLSKEDIARTLYAADRFLTRYMQLLPVASAGFQEEGEIVRYRANESPMSLDEVITFLGKIRTCMDYVKEMSGKESVEFAANQKLNVACREFVKELSKVSLSLIEGAQEYDRIKAPIQENCFAALQAKEFFNKEKDLFENGQNSLFSHSDGERKTISVRFPHRSDEYRFLGETAFKDLTECRLITPDVEIFEEKASFALCNTSSDQVFARLREELVRVFAAFSAADVHSVDQMQRIFNTDSIEQLRKTTKEILEEMKREGFIHLDRMIDKEEQIEKEVLTILDGVCNISENEVCDASPSGSYMRPTFIYGVAILAVVVIAVYHQQQPPLQRQRHEDQSNLDRVEPYKRELSLQKQLHGDRAHPDIVESYLNLGEIYFSLKDFSFAIKYFNYALGMQRAIYGNEARQEVIYSLICLGASSLLSECILQGREMTSSFFEQGIAMQKELRKNRAQNLAQQRQLLEGQPNPDTIELQLSRGEECFRVKNLSEAIRHFAYALSMQQAIYGNGVCPEMVYSQMYLGAFQLLYERYLQDHVVTTSQYFEEGIAMQKELRGNRAHPVAAVGSSFM